MPNIPQIEDISLRVAQHAPRPGWREEFSLDASNVFVFGNRTRKRDPSVIIDRQLRPEILRASDPRFEDMVRYMEWASEGFDHRFTVDGDEIAISG